jgi:hypothetical protein
MYAGVPTTAPVRVRRASSPTPSASRRALTAELMTAAAVGVGFFGGELAGGAGEAEVEDADAAVAGDEDVVGLEVAVDEAGVVGGGQAGAGLAHDRHDLAPRPRLLLEPGAEGLAVDELHGEEHAVGVGADVVDGDDVGVRQAGRGPWPRA